MRFWMKSWRHAVFAASLSAAAALSPPALAAELVVGQVAPLTGVLASTGAQMALGPKIWFDEVNARGGVHGAKIRHVVLDDGYKVPDTVQRTRELVQRPDLLALIGFAGTANIAELLNQNVLQQAGVALIAPYTGGEPLRQPFNPWIFHIRASYADETEHMVEHLLTLGMDRIGVVYQNDGFGESGLAGVKAALAKRKLSLVASASYERNTDQVDQAVRTMRSTDVRAIIMVAVNKPAASFAKGYRAAGGGAQLFNISVVNPAELVQLAGQQAVHGLGISQVVPYPYSQQLPVVREYQALLRKHSPGAEINYTSFEEFLGAKVLVEALQRAGPAPTRAKVIQALESLQNLDLGGVTFSYSPTQRVGSRLVEVTVLSRDGKLLK